MQICIGAKISNLPTNIQKLPVVGGVKRKNRKATELANPFQIAAYVVFIKFSKTPFTLERIIPDSWHFFPDSWKHLH